MHRILLLFALALAVPLTNQVTLRIPLQPGPQPEEIAVVTFDTNRVSAEELKRWMLLHENSYFHSPMFGYYPDCKPGDIPKLEKEIRKTEQMVNDLDPSKYPAELTDVVRYLKGLQSFWLWMAQQELAFRKSGKLPQAEYNGVDLRICEARNSEDKPRMCHEVLHRWHNCANNSVGKRLGSYPKEKWKAFLDSFGIQERIESTLD